MSDTERGFYRKFTIERTDGSSEPGRKHDGCAYFVLDLDHDEFAVPALRAYAHAARSKFPALAEDIDRITTAHGEFVDGSAKVARRILGPALTPSSGKVPEPSPGDAARRDGTSAVLERDASLRMPEQEGAHRMKRARRGKMPQARCAHCGRFYRFVWVHAERCGPYARSVARRRDAR